MNASRPGPPAPHPGREDQGGHSPEGTAPRRDASGTSERRLAALIEQTLVGITQVDMTGRFTLASQRYCDIVGRSEAELLSLRMQDITHPEDLPSNLVCFKLLVTTGKPFVIEKRYVRPDGTSVWVSNSVSLVRDAEGRPEGVVAVTQDITDRRRAEEDKERFFLLAPDLFCIAGTDGYFKRVNAAFTTALGWSEEELLSRPYLEFVHPEDRDATVTEARNGAEGLPILRFVNRYRCKDGSLRHLSWVATPLSSEGLIYASARDITEQREAEEERQRLLHQVASEQARLRAVIDQMAAGLYMAEAPSGKLLLANTTAEHILGHPLLASESVEDYGRFGAVHPDGRPYLPEEYPLARALAMGQPVTEEMLYQRPDGRRITLSVNSAPVRDASGSMVAGVSSFIDITARKRAEESLRFLSEASCALAESLEPEVALVQVARIAAGSIASFCLIDLAGEEDHLHRVAAAHGDPAKAGLIAQALRFPPGPRPGSLYAEVLRTGTARLLPEITPEHRAQLATSPEHRALIESLAPVSAMFVPIVARGRTLGIITLSSSEPWRRYGEDELATAEELARRVAAALENARLYRDAQSAVRLRDEFLSVASHELRTPVTSLKLHLHLLDRTLSPEAHQQAQERLADVDRQVGRISSLVNSLLDVSRISAGRLELEWSDVDVAALTREALQRLAPLFTQGGSSVHLEAPEAPVVARIDAQRMDQVLVNLLSNAAKYGAGHPVHVTVRAESGRVVLRVRDQGIGIAPEALPRLFQRFERAVSDKHYGGLGLGLFITRQLVEAMGGRVSAESQHGQGAIFTVELPLRPDESWRGKEPT